MKIHIGLLVSFLMLTVMTRAENAQTLQDTSEQQSSLLEYDIPFSAFDSIATHASVIYASRVLNENGFKLAYGTEVKQRKNYYSDIAFVKGAEYDETTQKWIYSDDVPYTYIRLIYDDYSQQICHIQIKFRNRIGYALFFGESIKSGYWVSEPNEKMKRGKCMRSVYFRYTDDSYIQYSEYKDNTYYIDYWKGWSQYKFKKNHKDKD